MLVFVSTVCVGGGGGGSRSGWCCKTKEQYFVVFFVGGGGGRKWKNEKGKKGDGERERERERERGVDKGSDTTSLYLAVSWHPTWLVVLLAAASGLG